jgi:hypothetical protein
MSSFRVSLTTHPAFSAFLASQTLSRPIRRYVSIGEQPAPNLKRPGILDYQRNYASNTEYWSRIYRARMMRDLLEDPAEGFDCPRPFPFNVSSLLPSILFVLTVPGHLQKCYEFELDLPHLEARSHSSQHLSLSLTSLCTNTSNTLTSWSFHERWLWYGA